MMAHARPHTPHLPLIPHPRAYLRAQCREPSRKPQPSTHLHPHANPPHPILTPPLPQLLLHLHANTEHPPRPPHHTAPPRRPYLPLLTPIPHPPTLQIPHSHANIPPLRSRHHDPSHTERRPPRLHIPYLMRHTPITHPHPDPPKTPRHIPTKRREMAHLPTRHHNPTPHTAQPPPHNHTHAPLHQLLQTPRQHTPGTHPHTLHIPQTRHIPPITRSPQRHTRQPTTTHTPSLTPPQTLTLRHATPHQPHHHQPHTPQYNSFHSHLFPIRSTKRIKSSRRTDNDALLSFG